MGGAQPEGSCGVRRKGEGGAPSSSPRGREAGLVAGSAEVPGREWWSEEDTDEVSLPVDGRSSCSSTETGRERGVVVTAVVAQAVGTGEVLALLVLLAPPTTASTCAPKPAAVASDSLLGLVRCAPQYAAAVLGCRREGASEAAAAPVVCLPWPGGAVRRWLATATREGEVCGRTLAAAALVAGAAGGDALLSTARGGRRGWGDCCCCCCWCRCEGLRGCGGVGGAPRSARCEVQQEPVLTHYRRAGTDTRLPRVPSDSDNRQQTELWDLALVGCLDVAGQRC